MPQDPAEDNLSAIESGALRLQAKPRLKPTEEILDKEKRLAENVMREQLEFLIAHHQNVHTYFVQDCCECARWGAAWSVLMKPFQLRYFEMKKD